MVSTTVNNWYNVSRLKKTLDQCCTDIMNSIYTQTIKPSDITKPRNSLSCHDIFCSETVCLFSLQKGWRQHSCPHSLQLPVYFVAANTWKAEYGILKTLTSTQSMSSHVKTVRVTSKNRTFYSMAINNMHLLDCFAFSIFHCRNIMILFLLKCKLEVLGWKLWQYIHSMWF